MAPLSRRTLFGLFAGAAVAPKVALAAPAAAAAPQIIWREIVTPEAVAALEVAPPMPWSREEALAFQLWWNDQLCAARGEGVREFDGLQTLVVRR